MNVSLTPELESFVAKKVESGRYSSASEVVREALRLLADQEALRAARLTDFQAELDRRLAEADRKAFVSPTAVRDELRSRSRGGKKSAR
jgi:antitoxin ParD1/3/4